MDFLGRAATFVRIVEAGSFSRAARSLGVSLSAISRQVTSLETELGATLLVRTTRAQRLTDEGLRFHAHATKLVREAELARASVRQDRSIEGNLTLSASVTLGLLRIVPGLPTLFAQHPALDLELRLEERAVDLVGDGVDVAVRAGLSLPQTTSLVAQPLATFPRYLVASPRYLRAAGTPRDVTALATHTAITGVRSGAVWELAEGSNAPVPVHMRVRLRVETLVGIRDAAVAGLGIAVLPDFVVADALATRTLVRVLPKVTLAPVEAHALYRVEARGSRRIAAVLAHLRASLPTKPVRDAAANRGSRGTVEA
ncbi:MAG: LysR family transcriptional regulator [Polyangiaceae bacterium]|nr:LysR family transcriptional regulator [Polyangiaceae bacterium]